MTSNLKEKPKKKRSKPKLGTRMKKVPWAKIGVGSGGLAIMGVTASWNIRGWVATATTEFDQVTNAVLSGGMEVAGACAMAAAAHQWAKDPKRGAALAAAGAMLFVFNTQAAKTNLDVQFDRAANAIERSGVDVANVEADIATWQTEIAAIRADYEGGVPRTEDQLRAEYSWLQDGLDPEKNPRLTAQFQTELTARARYDDLTDDIRTARQSIAEARVAANDEVRSVVPPNMRSVWIYSLQAFQAGLFWSLGSPSAKRPTKTPQPPANQNERGPNRVLSDEERARRKRYAIMRAKGRYPVDAVHSPEPNHARL